MGATELKRRSKRRGRIVQIRTWKIRRGGGRGRAAELCRPFPRGGGLARSGPVYEVGLRTPFSATVAGAALAVTMHYEVTDTDPRITSGFVGRLGDLKCVPKAGSTREKHQNFPIVVADGDAVLALASTCAGWLRNFWIVIFVSPIAEKNLVLSLLDIGLPP